MKLIIFSILLIINKSYIIQTFKTLIKETELKIINKYNNYYV